MRWAWSVSCFEIGLGFGGFWIPEALQNRSLDLQGILFCALHSAGEVWIANLVQATHLNGSSGMPSLDGCKLPTSLVLSSRLML